MASIVGGVTSINNPKTDYNQTDPNKADYLKNKPLTDQTFNPKSKNAQSGVALQPIFDSKADKHKILDFITYSITNNGTVTITGCDTSISGAFVIPDTIRGYPVTSIGSYAFDACSLLTSIVIPDSVTSIGSYAFDACGLKDIVIPYGVVGIKEGVFCACNKLESITIPESVASISYDAFLGTALKDVYYGGSKEQWDSIDKTDGNDTLATATIHYNQGLAKKAYVDNKIGDIETALDRIIAIQEQLIGGAE